MCEAIASLLRAGLAHPDLHGIDSASCCRLDVIAHDSAPVTHSYILGKQTGCLGMRDKARLRFMEDALGDCMADEALQILDGDVGAMRQVLVRDGES